MEWCFHNLYRHEMNNYPTVRLGIQVIKHVCIYHSNCACDLTLALMSVYQQTEIYLTLFILHFSMKIEIVDGII